MTSATEQLMRLATADDRFDHSHSELRASQLAALNERFSERRDRIKLLARRADEAGLTSIQRFEDAIPLLFPHTAYKSYPEAFLTGRKWDRLGKWLGTVSPYPIPPIDTSDIIDIDDWIDRLQTEGHHLTCTSGTTGRPAMLVSSQQDLEWSCADVVAVFAWGSGVQPAQDRRMLGIATTASSPRNTAIGTALHTAYSDPAKEPFRMPIPPITTGSLTSMIALRKKIADGTALPEELATFERTSEQRQQALDKAMVVAAETLVAHREEKLYLSGMWSALYEAARLVREMGSTAVDFHPDNCLYVGGGRKGAQLPADYEDFVNETFNIGAERKFQMYSMQELNSGMPRCQAGGRYHVPPWVIPFVLDEDGEVLLSPDEGEIEGRAAFFDLSLDGRWGGVITGDKISLDFGRCACGNAGPSVRDDITRYAELAGDDKIACSGTVDAYVRGLA
ncbi:hypothetical protein [Nocardia jiangxiensis]|uniref:hypothetical protein n=1 Tax=Nocardia jiangxiensis TaxID=282685 RepID=UPI00031AE039|nr:hypothetical protein [Nocardia jiangxiensis]